MSRFKKGQTVWSGRGKHEKSMVVARVIDNGMLPIYQYTFESPHDGFACGEQSIRETQDGRDLKLGECFKDSPEDMENNRLTAINTLASAAGRTIDFEELGTEREVLDSGLFFKPSIELVEWLQDYAGDRMIIDVGAGQGHLVRMLKVGPGKIKAMGLEPNFNYQKYTEGKLVRGWDAGSTNEILPWTIDRAKSLITGFGKDKVLLVFARPCHGRFVMEGIHNMPKGMEALYITLPENVDGYDDLGSFKKDAILLDHKGVSEENEVIYSITRK